MALHYDLTNVPDWKERFPDTVHPSGRRERHPTLFVFCMISIHAGTPEVTPENYVKVFRRIAILEKIMGAMRYKGEGNQDWYFTLAEIKSLIGIRTNVTAYTDADFKRHVWNILESKVSETIKEQIDQERDGKVVPILKTKGESNG